MEKSLHQTIETAILQSDPGSLFVVSDFLHLGSYEAVKRALARMAKTPNITRVMRGLYQKADTTPPSPFDVAFALARQHAWTIVPSGDTALILLGFKQSSDPAIEFISDGPYRKIQYDDKTIFFKHRMKREITPLSFQSALIVEGLNAIGEEHLKEAHRRHLRKLLTTKQLATLKKETQRARVWIQQFIQTL